MERLVKSVTILGENNMKSYKKLLGVGLIEVLVATVVISTGLLSVASMQGNFLGTSAENKIQEEAKNLCQTKLESFREHIEDTGTTYQTIASSTANESIVGVNETFTRSWVVTDKTNPAHKEITVTCSWDEGKESVISQGIISFQDLSTSLTVAADTNPNSTSGDNGDTGGTNTLSPSTNGGSGDIFNDPFDTYITEIDAYIAENELTDTIIKPTTDGKGTLAFICDNLTPLSPYYNSPDDSHPNNIAIKNAADVYTRRINYNTDTLAFNDAIELFHDEDGTGTYCIRKPTFEGGVIIPISGTVYSTKSNTAVNTFPILTSESGTFCSYTSDTSGASATYVCYIGGNCINGSVDTDQTAEEPSFRCPTGTYPDDAYTSIVEGGWRGKIGLLNILPQTNGDKGYNICFAEELADNWLTKDAARNYFTQRGSGSTATNEGINQSYACHDFLIIDAAANDPALDTDCIAAQTSLSLTQVSSKNIYKAIATDAVNIFNPNIDTESCSIGLGGGVPTTIDISCSKSGSTWSASNSSQDAYSSCCNTECSGGSCTATCDVIP